MNRFVTLISTAAIAAASTGALNAQVFEPVTTTIETADLDLTSAQGQERLNVRIEAAAKQVCQEGADTVSLTGKMAYKHCLVEAKNGALAQIKSRTDQALAIAINK